MDDAGVGGNVFARNVPAGPEGNTALTEEHVNPGICVARSAARMALAAAMPLADPERVIWPL